MAVETGIDLHTILGADDALFATIYAICVEIWDARATASKRK